jgi:hypothetical protein
MDALHRAIGKIQAAPSNAASVIFSGLIKSLDSGGQFDLNQLYQLNYPDFSLAIELLKQWRLDSFRYERGWATKLATEPSSQLVEPYWVPTGLHQRAVS